MRNLILQHFDGNLRPLDYESQWNIMDYADMIDADYKLVLGKPFRQHLTNACQKVHMIHEEFDDWDNVLMLDIDMFRPTNMNINVFEERGIGLYASVQQNLHRRLVQWHPMLASMDAPYWGGAIYKMDRYTRQTLRKQLGGNEGWMQNFNKPYNYEDEGIMHVLAFRSGFKTQYPYMDQKWCQCSFLPNPENAGFIHVRTKITPQGPKQDKILNWQNLVDQKILSAYRPLNSNVTDTTTAI